VFASFPELSLVIPQALIVAVFGAFVLLLCRGPNN
jgi:hypothetical protein